jgi:hypothetical protein
VIANDEDLVSATTVDPSNGQPLATFGETTEEQE